ncbi:hypothetical protein HF668_11735 [Acidithiobacillus ferridurans]|jgi:hypothetical protein|uniref:DUF6236 family protein n=1 Tax=Acidithiobacillus ferridurans TaxID=1232575 RepID=UPI001C0691D8|nr:DUF6236 family protein [Acidithiobacillus ferridurans]MBU2805801.1 hypothetical protein [Acidithiobacillus ferridurans]
MSNNVLYFPYIDVPSTSWTTQAILYWDKLASIIPMDHLHNPARMDKLTRELLSEGLVEAVVPGMYIHQVSKFDECFIEFVETRVLPNRRRSRPSKTPLPVTRIHAEKMGQIPDFLVDSGLATQLGLAWYEVDTLLANQFMAYLATVLGALPDVNATPITDQAQFAVALGSKRPAAKRDGALHTFKARDVVLKSLLPIPNGPIDFGRLIKFKERHGHLLPSLRAKIEAHCADISLLQESETRVFLTEAFIRDCKDHVAEIEAAMRPSFASVAFGSLAPLFGAGLTFQATEQGNVLGYAGATFSLVGAAYLAISSIRGSRLTQEAKPLAYIARARNELLPNE